MMTTVYDVASTGDTGRCGMCLSVIALKGSSSAASAPWLAAACPPLPAPVRCSAEAAKDREAAKLVKLPLLVCSERERMISVYRRVFVKLCLKVRTHRRPGGVGGGGRGAAHRFMLYHKQWQRLPHRC